MDRSPPSVNVPLALALTVAVVPIPDGIQLRRSEFRRISVIGRFTWLAGGRGLFRARAIQSIDGIAIQIDLGRLNKCLQLFRISGTYDGGSH